jgi:hypothetical protein
LPGGRIYLSSSHTPFISSFLQGIRQRVAGKDSVTQNLEGDESIARFMHGWSCQGCFKVPPFLKGDLGGLSNVIFNPPCPPLEKGGGKIMAFIAAFFFKKKTILFMKHH